MADKKPFWETKGPAKVKRKLSPEKLKAAKARAKAAGRPWPNRVDTAWASQQMSKKKGK